MTSFEVIFMLQDHNSTITLITHLVSQLLEEELVGTKHELEEVNTSSATAEEELADTQVEGGPA